MVAWRGGGRWLTYIWSIDQWVVENSTAIFTKGTGNQGGEGTDHGQEWCASPRGISVDPSATFVIVRSVRCCCCLIELYLLLGPQVYRERAGGAR